MKSTFLPCPRSRNYHHISNAFEFLYFIELFFKFLLFSHRVCRRVIEIQSHSICSDIFPAVSFRIWVTYHLLASVLRLAEISKKYFSYAIIPIYIYLLSDSIQVVKPEFVQGSMTPKLYPSRCSLLDFLERAEDNEICVEQ